MSDQAGARYLFAENLEKLKNLKKIWVDGTYRGVEWHKEVKEEYGIELEVSRNLGRSQRVCRASQTLVGGTHFWLVYSITTVGTRIRKVGGKQRSDVIYFND